MQVGCALREAKRGNGVVIELKFSYVLIQNHRKKTNHGSFTLHVLLRKIQNWDFTTKYSEPDETEEIKWIPS